MTAPAGPGTDHDISLEDRAQRIRAHIVEMCAQPLGGHLGGSMSLVEILTALYFRVLQVSPDAPADPARDVLLLSKGHGAIGLYSALAERGFLPVPELATYAQPGSRLAGHPTRAVPGVEMPTGSLGHGLPLGLGFALAARLDRLSRRTFVIMGDGELQEGSVWEAAISAADLRLDHLVAIVDSNGFQLTGRTEDVCGLEPLPERWAGFGWAVREIDGHDLGQVLGALSAAPWEPGRPSVVIARTTKGHGVPFVEGRPQAHFLTLSGRNLARARAAVKADGGSDD